ncbi:MAG TPA: guanylate kinase, partial [Atribacteraceae bacterium]|nr:guanylate kinase [Atribacteraceae bacterium]
MSGLLFVISGPSGVGKSTLRKTVISCCDGLRYSVSVTTRLPRSGEREGLDYTFIDNETFERMKKEHAFLEWAKVHGNYYGTPRKPIEAWLAQGCDVILEIDIQGAQQVRWSFPEGVFVYIAPPSLQVLEKRLR